MKKYLFLILLFVQTQAFAYDYTYTAIEGDTKLRVSRGATVVCEMTRKECTECKNKLEQILEAIDESESNGVVYSDNYKSILEEALDEREDCIAQMDSLGIT